jgi:hypothetical protein
MTAAELIRETDRICDMLGLNQRAEALVPKTKDGRRALALLACQEKRLQSLHRRLLEAALVELLWEYMDCVEGTDAGYVVRQLIADIGIVNDE